MRRHSAIALLSLSGLFASACAFGTVDDIDVERRDPATITWIAPTLDQSFVTGDAVTLTVSSASPDAHRVDFALDGVPVASCDASDPLEDCRQDNLWSITTTLTAAGTHTLTASFRTHDGRTISDAREVTVLDAATTATPVDPGSPGTEPDPGSTEITPDIPTDPLETPPEEGVDDLMASEIGELPPDVSADQAITRRYTRGYLDPSRSFHNVFNGRQWAVRGQRIVPRRGRIFGDVAQVSRCMALYGDDIETYTEHRYISRASILALIIAETGCTNPAPRAGAVRGGPLAVTASVCSALNPGLNHRDCLLRMNLLPSVAIETAVRYLSAPSMRRVHHNDPVKLAAVFHVGGLRRTRANAWHLVTPSGYLTRFVQAYNAYRSWESLGRP